MQHVVEHDLTPDLAKKAAMKAFDAYAERLAKYDPKANWTSDDHADISFEAKGIKLKGTLDLQPRKIVMNLDVPFILRVFQKKATGVIDSEIQKWVGRAKAGEL